jgi:hypothetical protein
VACPHCGVPRPTSYSNAPANPAMRQSDPALMLLVKLVGGIGLLLVIYLIYKETRPSPAVQMLDELSARVKATMDVAKLASVKTDIRNAETAEEAYFSDHATYVTLNQLQVASNFVLSNSNTMSITPAAKGYSVTASNSTISSGITTCHVQIGSGVASSVDGYITCP